MPEHHLVGTVIGEMIPRRTIDSISGTRGFEIVRVAYRQTDAVSDVMLCFYFANACAENLDFSKVRFATCFLGATKPTLCSPTEQGLLSS